jgi:ribosomal protein L37E
MAKENENRVKCGRCSTEFDINKNLKGCPLCGFGKGSTSSNFTIKKSSYLSVPPKLNLKAFLPIVDEERKIVGAWGMFNDFFSGKAVCRILAHVMNETGNDYIKLDDLIKKTTEVFADCNLSELKGFPKDLQSDSSVGRLVYHFISTFANMGLLNIKSNNKSNWTSEGWNNVLITLTKDGYEFAKLRNKIFDDNDRSSQVLTVEEREWMIEFLKEIDKKGYKEYSILYEVYTFIKKGHNGKNDLWKWFRENKNFRKYLEVWSRKVDKPKEFEKQIANLAQTFAAGKLSLLRELGIISDRRNDYTVIGEL